MGVSCQPMENAQIRSIYQMSSEMTGVLISKINPLSDAHKILKKEDVILAFDGVPIGNDGTGRFFSFIFHEPPQRSIVCWWIKKCVFIYFAVPLRKKERITFDHMVSMKKPNETALVKVLREGKEHEFCITLRPVSQFVTNCRTGQSSSDLNKFLLRACSCNRWFQCISSTSFQVIIYLRALYSYLSLSHTYTNMEKIGTTLAPADCASEL